VSAAASRASGATPQAARGGRLAAPALQPAYLLHRYDWSESSLILDLFTREQGRVAVAAKGAKRPYSQLRAVLLPFQRLNVAYGVRRAREGEGEGSEVQPRLLELEPVGLHGDRLLAFQQRHDGGERLLHAVALGRGIDAHHVGVRRQRARAAAQHGPPARHMVELHEAVRDHQRVMIRQAGHARAEADVARSLDGGPEEHLRPRADVGPRGR